MKRRQFLTLVGGVAISLAAIGGVSAQVYPSRPITMIVPFPPGGSTDTIGRIVAERMRARLGQLVIIENVGGAAGSIGVGRVARAAPDGHTIDIGQWDTHIGNGAIYALQYDLAKDFEPVALLASSPYLILAKKTMPADDLQSLVAWLKANPDKASQGNPTAGSHVAGLLLQKHSGTRFQFVPYRGAAPAMQDLLAGQIDLLITLPAVALQQVRSAHCSPPRARRRRSPTSSTPPLWKPWAIRMCARGLPILDRKSRLVISRRRRHSVLSTRPKSRNGGRSSRRQTSRRNERVPQRSFSSRVAPTA
jgi:tripartite-type tricarboxylate transporter receptor subunit TctC